MTKILLLGGTGYCGSALDRHLTLAGHDVVSVDLEMRGNGGNEDNIKMDYADLSQSILSEYPVIILLAAHSTVARCLDDPMGAIENNVVNPAFLLTKLEGQKFIYASSGSVTYGQTFTSIYDVTKRGFDKIAAKLYPEAIGLRLGTVCGPAPNIRRTMINAMVLDSLKVGEFTVCNRNVRRPILGIRDFCRSVEFAIDNHVEGGCHDLCTFNSTVGDIAEIVRLETGAKLRVTADEPGYDFTMIPAGWCVREQGLRDIIHDLMMEYSPGTWI